MPSNPSAEFLFALRRFVQAIDPKNTDPTMLHDSELSAGREVMSAIDKIVDARVQAVLNNVLPRQVAGIVADHKRRTP